MRKKLAGLLIVLVIIISTLMVPDMVQAKSKGYLVLVRNQLNNKWTAHEDLVCKSPKGNLMIKAATISKLLGFEYGTTNKGFKITYQINKVKKSLAFTKGSNQYSYYDGSETVKHKSVYKAYTSKDFKSSANVIHYTSLKDLGVNISYFKKSEMQEKYKELGYSGVICYSTIPFDSRENLPSLYQVVDTKGNALVELEPVSYDGYITINGVKIPKLSGFSESALIDPKGVWGADVSGDRKLEQAIKEFSSKMRNDIINLGDESNQSGNSQIAVKDNSISAEINGDSSMSAIRLSKQDDHYEIYLSTRLTYTETDKELRNPNYTKITNNVLRLFANIVTSDGDLLYETIYNDAEVDSTKISKDKWTTFGNFQIKYRVEDRKAIVFSIRAK